jgi:hypothetical protein
MQLLRCCAVYGAPNPALTNEAGLADEPLAHAAEPPFSAIRHQTID